MAGGGGCDYLWHTPGMQSHCTLCVAAATEVHSAFSRGVGGDGEMNALGLGFRRDHHLLHQLIKSTLELVLQINSKQISLIISSRIF